MFARIAVTSNNDKSIRTTNTYIHHMPKGNPVCRVWMCKHRISFNLHDIHFEKKKTNKVKAEMEVKFCISVILFKEEKNTPILKCTNLNTSI